MANRRRASRAVAAVGLTITLLFCAAVLWPPPFASFLDHKAYDVLLRAVPPTPPTGRVVLVPIDDRSLERHGQWPWPRRRLARLLLRIAECRPAAVGLDMVLAEADRTSLSLLSAELQRELGVVLDLSGLPREATDADSVLAAALATGPFVLGHQFDFSSPRGDASLLAPFPGALRTRAGTTDCGLFEARGVVGNLPALSRAASASGFVNVIPDRDGVLRRAPLLIRHGGETFPSLALACVLRAQREDAVLECAPGGEALLRLGRRGIPLDPVGNLLVRYRGGRGTLPSVPAGDVLDGDFDPAALKGKVVIVGATATGLHESRTTPLDAAHPGPEIQATIADNLLAGDPVASPAGARALQLALVALPGLLVTALAAWTRTRRAVAAAVPLAALAWIGSGWLLESRGVFLPPVLPALSQAALFAALSAVGFLQAERVIRKRNRELALTQEAIILSLASLAETRHQETGGHIQRTRHYVRALAERLRRNPRFRDRIDDEMVELLFRLAPLHDIGKVGIRDAILLKPGALTAEEYEEMKRHVVLGSETIRVAEKLLGSDRFLRVADDMIKAHQEWWDGSGYPNGLKGEEIPLAGRLMALADVYDALISPRGYKDAIPHDEAVRMIEAGRGTHFDPDVVDAFLEVRDRFREIASRFSGGGAEPSPLAPKGA